MAVTPSVNTGYQAYTQPSIATGGSEAPARPDSVQHRNAPAADSHRSDQRDTSSRNDDTSTRRTRGGDGGTQASPGSSDRGSVVDLSV